MPTTAPTRLHKPHPVIRYVNFAIGAVALICAGAVFWFVYRPLPQTSGTIPAPVAQHITAASEDDAYFGQGYAVAQDRLFQMDGLRRLAAGDLSEIVGPGT